MMTLIKCSSNFFESNRITNYEREILRYIISLRNWINHQLFLDLEQVDSNKVEVNQIQELHFDSYFDTKLTRIATKYLLHEAQVFIKSKHDETFIPNIVDRLE